jgi:hypothetical protein
MVVIAHSLVFRLVVTFGCHVLSARGVGRFLRYSAGCAVLNTVKIAYSMPDDKFVINSPRRKTGNSA